jgi:dimethylaniline monooxygenase (N-oxide forming)
MFTNPFGVIARRCHNVVATTTATKRTASILRRWSSSTLLPKQQHQQQHQQQSVLVLADKLRQQLDDSEDTPLLMGCVCYDPAVYDIWGGIKDYLIQEAKVPFDFILFTNYEQQVASLIRRHIDIAWNGPLAHVLLEQEISNNPNNNLPSNTVNVASLGMRDVDRDFESVLIVKTTTMAKNIFCVDDLNGLTVVTGACDSPQAHIVPLYYLQSVKNVQFADVQPQNLDLGKHGDTAAGEVQALEMMIRSGNTTTSSSTSNNNNNNNNNQVQMAIVSKVMWDRACQGMLPSINPQELMDTCQVLETVELPLFDHCQFDAIVSNNDPPARTKKLQNFAQALLDMDMDNPKHQTLMKLEGIQKKWEGPRQTGYDIVRNAMIPGQSLSRHRSAINLHPLEKRSFTTSATTVQQNNHDDTSKKLLRVAVIGAGIAGLQTVRALGARSERLQVTAFEGASTVGGLWKENYSNFGVQVPKQLFEFQDFPMTEVKWGEYATGPQVQAYIEQYTDAFGLRDSIQFNTHVTSVMQQPASESAKGHWKLGTENTVNGSKAVHNFDYVVVSTGLYSSLKKFVPTVLAGKDNVLHSCDFQDASVVMNQKVIVVGSGKSAVDCAVEAHQAGASSVTLLQRTAHWPTPRKIAGIIPFQYIFLSRFGQALVSTHTNPIPGSGWAINTFRNSGVGPLIMKPVFRAVEELFAFQFGLYGNLRPKMDVVKDFYDVALVLDSKLTQLRKSGKIHVQIGEMEAYDATEKRMTLKDGSLLEADFVVCATGFEQEYSIFDDATKSGLDLQDDGLYLYRCILPECVPNLAFIGHTSCISNISSYGLQAEWLARYLSNELVMSPTPNDISNDIQARKSWARSWMPETSNRGMNVLLHQTHYHDQLLRDMGENPSRKSNPFAEYLMPYEPADYNGVMAGHTT